VAETGAPLPENKITGNAIGEMRGGFGTGRSGFGPGGGRTRWGTIGSGRYGTIGHGSGRGLTLRGGRTVVPRVRTGPATATGNLTKAIIRRIIRRYLRRIRYCYERVLLVNPKVKGKIPVRFVIGPSGAVVRARADKGNKKVARCVERVIKQMRFPAPRGGGNVTVRYPFTFSTTGGGGGRVGGKVPPQVRMKIEKVAVEGLASAKANRSHASGITTHLYHSFNPMAACLDHARLRGQTRLKRVGVRLRVGKDGHVRRVVTVGADRTLRACLRKVLSKAKLVGGPKPVVARFILHITGSARAVATVSLGSLYASGGLPKAVVRRTLGKKLPRFRRCYVTALSRSKSLRGKAVLQFTLSPASKVVHARTTGVPATLGACLSRVARTVKLPKHRAAGAPIFKQTLELRASGLIEPHLVSAPVRKQPDTVSKARPEPVTRQKPKPVERPKLLSLAKRTWKYCRTASPRPVTRRLPALRDCYAAALKQHPTLRGRLQLAYYADARGNIASVHLFGPNGHHLQGCFQRAFSPRPPQSNTPYRAVRCELALTNGSKAPLPVRGTTVAVSATNIRITAAGKTTVLMPTGELFSSKDAKVLRKEVAARLHPLLTGIRRGARVVAFRVDPEVDVAAVAVLAGAFGSLGINQFRFWEKSGSGWSLTSDYLAPSWPHDCHAPKRSLQLMVSAPNARLTRGKQVIGVLSRATNDSITEIETLLDRSRKRWPNRRQLRIRVLASHPYEVLTKTIRAAAKRGYLEPLVVFE
jgi:hypothetical protein